MGCDIHVVLQTRDRDEDILYEILDGTWIGDHSFSWLTAEEFITSIDKAETETDYIGRWRTFRTILSILITEYGSENVRVVFGFDS
jgi:hypothetical protein